MVFINLASALVGALAFISTVTAAPQADFPDVCGPNGVEVRLPPSMGPTPPTWKPHAPSWYFKPWNMVYASHSANLQLRNFQYDPTPMTSKTTAKAPQINDLSSFQVPNNATVYTSYGVDTPDPQHPGVLSYAGTGILTGATSVYSELAWGCDMSNYPYYVNYATETELSKTPAGIDIMSTFDKGVDQPTFDAIVERLQGLGNEEIAAMAGVLKRTVQDGARNGQSRIRTCDERCKSNANLEGLLG